MEPINKLFFGSLVLVLSTGIAFVLFKVGLLGLTWSIILGILIFIVGINDTATVDINKSATYKNRWSKKLVDDSKPEGEYWTFFYTYYIYSLIDNTKNEYSIKPLIDTKNRIRGSLPISMWCYIGNVYKNQRVGSDVDDSIKRDLEDTIKAWGRKFDDTELEEKQGSEITLMNIVSVEGGNDSIWNTLSDAGIYVNRGNPNDRKNPVINVGTFEKPQSIIDSDLQIETTRRKAKADDFQNAEHSKKIDNILIEDLLPFLRPVKTFRELRNEAIRKLDNSISSENDHYSHEDEQLITDQMLADAKNLLPTDETDANYLSAHEIKKMRNEAETKLSVREGRTKDYRGLDKTIPMINI